MSDAPPLPFEGLRVVDIATVIAGPAAAMILGDFGADVIKVEPPEAGDLLRAIAQSPIVPQNGTDWLWHLDSRNKRGLILDLKHPEGREVLLRLIDAADVLVTNQPLQVRERLGLTWEQLAARNPRLIYASLTAFGEQGPLRNVKGFDQLAYWNRSGLMDRVRGPSSREAIQGLPGMGDHPTSVALFASIVTALWQRERTGQGGLAHTSLLANGIWSAACIAQGVIAGGDMTLYHAVQDVQPVTQRVYACADDIWLQLNMVRTPEEFEQLVVALECPEILEDERFTTIEGRLEHRGPLGDALAAAIIRRPAAEWLPRFEAAGLEIYAMSPIEDAAIDPQLEASGVVRDTGVHAARFGTRRIIDHPVNASNAATVGPRPAPALGEHADEILGELGYDAAAIAALRESGALGGPAPGAATP